MGNPGLRLDMKKSVPFAIVAAALAAVAFLPRFASAYSVVFCSSVIMYAALSLSYAMFSGPTGYVSLATAAFFGVGIYTSAFFGKSLPLPALMIAGGVFSSVIAFAVGAITLRLRGVYFTIFTFGLVELLKHFVLWTETTFAGTRGRTVASFGSVTVFYCMLALLTALLLAAFLLRRSRVGKALSAIGESEDAAAHIGINTTAVKLLAFSLSSFAMGAAGAVMATRWAYIDPGIAFNSLMSFMPALMAIFGGTDRLLGPVAGAIVFAALEEQLITRFPSLYMIIFGAIMIAAILFMPSGVTGLIRRRPAKRKEDVPVGDS
ncbi:MAG: branched-chain amino acid ABC transporter permease [Oscillospiraceae bacterium]|jgi:branched-chain amino acid transport system permease protein|nr:branched-chain amino acid ABC transporter permease [Oscillospiraceae bacterium]